MTLVESSDRVNQDLKTFCWLKWVLNVLAPIPPVSTVTSDGSLPLDHQQTHKLLLLYPPPVIVLVYSVICGFY
ncbi:hypothetical protein M0802_003279 [Mischocyttarus mexicanus]|nr:hypothetical protein M0802_003279 [Mischocyttarus mexicanus]